MPNRKTANFGILLLLLTASTSFAADPPATQPQRTKIVLTKISCNLKISMISRDGGRAICEYIEEGKLEVGDATYNFSICTLPVHHNVSIIDGLVTLLIFTPPAAGDITADDIAYSFVAAPPPEKPAKEEPIAAGTSFSTLINQWGNPDELALPSTPPAPRSPEDDLFLPTTAPAPKTPEDQIPIAILTYTAKHTRIYLNKEGKIIRAETNAD